MTGPIKKISFLEKMQNNRKWREIDPISLEDCINKSGQIEAGEPVSRKKGANKAPQFTAKKMGFGKYKDREKQWVKENDPSYWAWCIENVKNFKE